MSQITSVRNVLALRSLRGIGPAFFKKHLRALQGAVTHDDAYDLLITILKSKPSRQDWSEALALADKSLERCDELGIRALSILDPDYPTKVLEIGKPPSVLFLRGDISCLRRKTIGIIGTRQPTRTGGIIAARIGAYFASNYVSICNGLADGVDASSIMNGETCHAGCVGVMGGGLDLLELRLSPKTVTERAAKLLATGGLLVSEALPGAKEDTYSIISSCRVQAALSDAMVLVQSSMTGGSKFAVAAFCGLPRVLAFIDPPEQEREDEAFSANVALSREQSQGLAAFAEVKDVSATELIGLKSREDYSIVLGRLSCPQNPFI